ncbi:MAG: hypothetical protein O8C64_13790 [Candidatus Methanoperedens sp.]|nr:hypothetical protein [Candidatus Methanoperedens sp.]
MIVTAFSGCLTGNKNTPADMLEPRENSDGGIKISVTYLPEISDGTAFAIGVTAHMDYNDGFENSSYLRDSTGKIYRPVSYEGSRGHHAAGTLRFPKIETKGFELVIQDVGDVKERVFKW